MIFVLSVHHSGTWTTLKWLESHNDIGGVVECRFLERAMCDGSHFYLSEQKWARAKTVLHDHVAHYGGKFELDPRTLALALSLKTVIPIRDPLAICLSAQHRTEMRGQGFDGVAAASELDLFYTYLVWLKVDGIHQPEIIPWDLAPEDARGRKFWLHAHRLELKLEDCEATTRWAEDWPIENTKGDYAYKRAYAERDRAGLAEKLPEMWQRLQRQETLLRPFLEDYGYRDLIWWTE